MAWLSGGMEYIDLPVGETPVEVKRVKLLQLVNEDYDQEVHGWPPQTKAAELPDLAIGFRIAFGIYGTLESAWKTKSNAGERDRVTWASPWPILSLPYNSATGKFLKAWESWIAPALGGMADGFLREHVKNLGYTPAPAFYKHVLEGVRCIAVIVQRDKFFNVDGLSPNSSEGDYNLALVRKRLGESEVPDNELFSQLAGLAVALKEITEKNDVAITEDCKAVSAGRATRIEHLNDNEADMLIVEYTELWNKADAAIKKRVKATQPQRDNLAELYNQLISQKKRDMDAIIGDIRAVMPDADERKGDGKYLDALTQAEAESLTRIWGNFLSEEVPF